MSEINIKDLAKEHIRKPFIANSFSNSIFSLAETLINPNPDSGNAFSDAFGTEIAISGNKVLVGARFDDTFGNSSGAAYLFNTISGSLTQTFFYPQLDGGDTFGTAVDIDGNNVLIGATGENDFRGNGAALLFNATNGNLIQTFSVPNSNVFGSAVAIDGGKVLVGDVQNATFANVSGAAFLFKIVSGDLRQSFFPPNPDTEDFFGESVAINGGKVIIGASGGGGKNDSGTAYLFDPDNGKLTQDFLNPSPDAQDFFGTRVAISRNKVLISAPGDDTFGNNSGAAYLFDTTSGNLIQRFFHPNPDEGDFFGSSVAIDGNKVLIGARGDDMGGTNSGSAFLFDAVSGSIIQSFFNPSPAEDNGFGSSVAIDGDSLLIGSPGDDQGGSDSGAVFLFQATTFNIINGTSGKDKLVGTLGSDKINGLNSKDILLGLGGNDILNGGPGNDTLRGGAGDDTLRGGNGSDVLAGGAGNDILIDGGGKDKFLYDTGTAFTRDAVGIDIIQFFSHNYDIIVLDKTTFTTISSVVGTGFSNKSDFAVVGSKSAAETSTADIVYNSMNGNLFYNPNGSVAGFGDGGQFATLLDNRVLSATDFIIQA